MYGDDDLLLLSGIQHFSFCRRQWALIHIEQQWAENLLTVQGAQLHTKAHEAAAEKRGDLLLIRDLPVVSRELGLRGACDVVEFHVHPQGVELKGRYGKAGEKYHPVPVEYKRGKSKENDADRLQLCAQALCLEEMLVCDIPAGYLFYGETRRREEVAFDDALRSEVLRITGEMHAHYKRGHTPKSKPGKHCRACSLEHICVPALCKNPSVKNYMERSLEEVP